MSDMFRGLSGRNDRGKDLMQVAHDCVIGVRHDRRIAIGVDGNERLTILTSSDVLRSATDSAGDIEIWCDFGPSLPYLLGMWTPTSSSHNARASDRATE